MFYNFLIIFSMKTLRLFKVVLEKRMNGFVEISLITFCRQKGRFYKIFAYFCSNYSLEALYTTCPLFSILRYIDVAGGSFFFQSVMFFIFPKSNKVM